jgi:type III secretion system YscQ/HrcQ family protein
LASSIAAFPWNELPAATLRESQTGQAERLLCSLFEVARAADIVRELLGAELEGFGVTSRSFSSAVQAPKLAARLVRAEFELAVLPEAELIAFALTRVLGRPFRLADPTAAVSPALAAAGQALILEVARRLVVAAPPLLVSAEQTVHLGPAAQLQCWLRIDGRSFTCSLLLAARELPERAAARDVPLTLPLVRGHGALSRKELAELRVGDVWVLGGGSLRNAAGPGNVVAIAPEEEHGFQLQLSDSIAYLGPTRLPHEPPAPEQDSMDPITQQSAVLDAPVIVRVEVGSVTLSAREWMALQPGDVLSCGQPLNAPVVLRAAGVELGRGELVTVDGEVGVRVTQLNAVEPLPAGGSQDQR